MERPEKWKILDLDADIQTSDTYIRHKERVVSRNQAIDEYEKFLPSYDEIRELLKMATKENWKEDYTIAAKAILARLRGEE